KNTVRRLLQLGLYLFDQLLAVNGLAEKRLQNRQEHLRFIEAEGAVGHGSILPDLLGKGSSSQLAGRAGTPGAPSTSCYFFNGHGLAFSRAFSIYPTECIRFRVDFVPQRHG